MAWWIFIANDNRYSSVDKNIKYLTQCNCQNSYVGKGVRINYWTNLNDKICKNYA